MIFLYLPLVIVIFIVYGVMTSKRIEINTVNVDSKNNITIAQFSDIHINDEFQIGTYQKVINTFNEGEVDLVIFTGDMFKIESISEDLEKEVTSFFSSFTTINKIAILGNHDYYGEETTKTVIRILEKSGFTVLVNNNVILELNGVEFNIIGLDDFKMGNANYSETLKTSENYENNIVLSHEPDTFDIINPYNIQIVFSGHSHGGQLRLPLIGDIYNVPGAKKYNEKHYFVNETHLFISFGLGESMIPYRMYNHRQAEIYNIHN